MIDLVTDPEAIVIQQEPRRYLHGGKAYKSVTAVNDEAGFGMDFSRVPTLLLERAQVRGTTVHMACHFYDEGDLDLGSIDPFIRGYVDAYIRFDRECRGLVLAAEKKMVCPEILLAGTVDLVKFIGGRRAIVDRKTNNPESKAARLQTAGYKKLWNALYPKAPIYDRYGLGLQNNGVYRLKPHDDPEDEMAFDAALAFVRAKEMRDTWLKKYSVMGAQG